MNGTDKIAEAAQTVNEIKQTIQDKYDKVMGKIEFYRNEIQIITSESTKHTEDWINKKTKKLKEKIQDLTDKVKNWMEEQLRKAQEWLSEIKKEIEDFILQLSSSMVLAIAGI